jgi:hypothetical protein
MKSLWYKLLDSAFQEDGEPRAWTWAALLVVVVAGAIVLGD